MTTIYEVEVAPGQPRDPKNFWQGSGFRVVSITGGVRRPMLTRFRKREHAEDEATRLEERDRMLVSGAK